MDQLIVGLSIVDQLDGGRKMRQLAEGRMDRSPRPGRGLREAVAGALVAVAARLSPAIERPVTASHPAAGGAQS